MSKDPLAALDDLDKLDDLAEDGTDDEADAKTDDDAEDAANEAKGKDDDKSPPGFLSYEEYIEKGGDPDMYKGKKAFEAEYNHIQEIKANKREMKEIKETLSTVASIAEESKKRAVEEAVNKLKAELDEKTESGDVKGAIETQKQIDELEKQPEPTAPKVHPVVQEFIESNPLLDKESDQFNQDFYDDMAIFQAKELNELSDNGKAQLTESQIKKCTERAFEKAKKYNPDLFESPRNNRAGPGRQVKQGDGKSGGKDVVKQLRELKVHGRNPNDVNAAIDMYEMLKEKNEKQAEVYAKNILKEFAQ